MPATFADLLKAVPQTVYLIGDGNVVVTAPVVESANEVEPGGVFVARRGLSVDGHDFIPQAIARGAAAIVGERELSDLPLPYARVENAQEAIGYLAAAYWGYPSRQLTVIGVTGTDGKTTTSTLIQRIINGPSSRRAGLISTIAAQVGNKTLETGLHVTTPGAPQIQALLAQMVANGLRIAVLEMTSHGLAQGRLNGVDLDVAVLTNLTHEHLDYHGTFEAYRAAKGRMFAMLDQSFRKPDQPKISLINADDPNADYFAAFPADKVIRYGITAPDADYRAVNIRYKPNATSFQVAIKGRGVSCAWRTKLVGEFNVMNCLAAIETVFAVYPIASGYVERWLWSVEAISGRMERIDEGQSFLALADFAHTPNALANALRAAREMVGEGGRVIVVFGCAGLRDREKRRLMPKAANALADISMFTAEDPRTESLNDILHTMADAAVDAGGVEGKTFFRVPDRGEALYLACQMARAGDLVIACGKGHEQSMAFGTTEYAWDDREALRAALCGTPLKTLPTSKDMI